MKTEFNNIENKLTLTIVTDLNLKGVEEDHIFNTSFQGNSTLVTF